MRKISVLGEWQVSIDVHLALRIVARCTMRRMFIVDMYTEVNMKKHSLKVMISLLLVVSFTLGIVPVTVVAEKPKNTLTDLQKLAAGMVSVEDVYGALDSRTVPEIIGYDYAVSKAHVQRLYEDEGDNLNKVVFLNADGSRTAYLFDYPVKYVDDDGKPKDITLDIADSAVAGQFETAGGSAVTTFSGNVSDGIGLTGNHTSLSLVPHLPTVKADAVAVKSSGKTIDSTAKRVDSKTISYDYDSKTTIEYSLTYTGFKEDIVVSEYTGQTEYDFTLYTNGLTLKETDGNFYLVDRDNTVKATLGDIIIFTADEKNNTMGELRSQTIVENQEYLLTIVVDAEYLAAEETAYPIRIDPTVELCYDNNGSGAIEDATINSTGTTAGSSGSLMVGLRESYGVSRILMKFPGLDLDDLGDNVSITNATVELRDLMCESTGLEVSCYVFSGNTWSESSVNWSNVSPNSVSTFLSSHTISYSNGTKQATAHRYAFDITKAVEGWIAGNYNPNKGIVFKASNSVENGTTYKHKTMAAYNRNSYRPSLCIVYEEMSIPKVAEISCYNSEGYWDVPNGATATYVECNEPTERIRSVWLIEHQNNGYYTIRNYSTGYYVTNVNLSVEHRPGLTTIPDDMQWKFIQQSDGTFKIASKINAEHYLTENAAAHSEVDPDIVLSASDCGMRQRFRISRKVYAVSIYNYYDYSFQMRMDGSLTATGQTVNVINERQERVNQYLYSEYGIVVTNNPPTRRFSYADKCHGVNNISTATIEQDCLHGSCDGRNGLCVHVLKKSGSCISECPSAYHHNNSLKIHYWHMEDLKAPSADINILWTGQHNCSDGDAYVPWSSGTHITATLYNGNNTQEWDYAAFHETGHSLGAIGDNTCDSQACVMSYETDWETYFALLSAPDSNLFCDQCESQIRFATHQKYY